MSKETPAPAAELTVGSPEVVQFALDRGQRVDERGHVDPGVLEAYLAHAAYQAHFARKN